MAIFLQFFYKRLPIKYASHMQYVVRCLWFLTLKFNYSFPAVAILACLKDIGNKK